LSNVPSKFVTTKLDILTRDNNLVRLYRETVLTQKSDKLLCCSAMDIAIIGAIAERDIILKEVNVVTRVQESLALFHRSLIVPFTLTVFIVSDARILKHSVRTWSPEYTSQIIDHHRKFPKANHVRLSSTQVQPPSFHCIVYR
jgi:hypothetical protein